MDSGPPHAEGVVAFVARFDRGEYWLAHEELEEVWQEDRKDLYKGLIQVAAGFLHAERRNWHGARRLLSTALGYLGSCPDRAGGFDVAGIRAGVERVRRAVEERGAGDGSAGPPLPELVMARHFEGDVDPDGVAEVELPYRVRRHDEGYRPGTSRPSSGTDS